MLDSENLVLPFDPTSSRDEPRDFVIEARMCGPTIEGRFWWKDEGEEASVQEVKMEHNALRAFNPLFGFDGDGALRITQLSFAETDCVDPPTNSFLRGDCNSDGAVDMADAVSLLGTLFLGQRASQCDDACDSNDDEALDIADAIHTLGVLFLGQGMIPAPGMTMCGVDPTDEPDRQLDCETPARNCP